MEHAGIEKLRQEFKQQSGISLEVSDEIMLEIAFDSRFAKYLENAQKNKELVGLLIKNKEKEIQARNQAPLSNSDVILKVSKAIARWTKSGMKTVEPHILEKRLNACQKCPHLSAAPDEKLIYKLAKAVLLDDKTCRVSGCMVIHKAKLTVENCPLPIPGEPSISRWGEPIRVAAKSLQ
ncbi:MAG: hypothetical protein OQK51_16495 [Kangiellaceae bacterium]|nr:hypothetical protein [Kangiellaceae bacterium]